MEDSQLSIVVESVQLPPSSIFSLEIRLLHYDWSSVGSFSAADLPIGSRVILPVEKSLIFSEELKIDTRLRIEDDTFGGTLHLSKESEKGEFFARGVTVLFHEFSPNSLLFVTFLFHLEKIRPPSPPKQPSMENKEIQTERTYVRDAEAQVEAVVTMEKECLTEGRIVGDRQLEMFIEAVVEREIGEKQMENVEDISKQKKNEGENPSRLGYNVVPRLQKISVLDQMIENRERLLGAMQNTLRHSEIRRKMEYIRNQKKKMESIVKAEEKKKEEKEETGESEESTTSDDSSSSNASERSEGSTANSSNSDEEESEKEESDKDENSSVEDPFSPKKTKGAPVKIVEKRKEKEEQLSPTSKYLKELRERILHQRENHQK